MEGAVREARRLIIRTATRRLGVSLLPMKQNFSPLILDNSGNNI